MPYEHFAGFAAEPALPPAAGGDTPPPASLRHAFRWLFAAVH